MSANAVSSTSTPAAPSSPAIASSITSSDPSTALLELMLQSRGVQCSAAREEVNHAHDMLEEARRQIQAAMERAKDAQEDAGFWGDLSNLLGGDLACIAEVVAAGATVVATGGLGGPAVLALVAAGLSIGAEAGKELGLDPKVCLILGAGAALAGIAAGRLDAAGGFWLELARGAQITQGVATAGGGAAYMVKGQYEGDVKDAEADAVNGRGQQDDAMLRFDLALEQLQQAARDIQRGESAATSSVKSESDGRLAIVARMGAM